MSQSAIYLVSRLYPNTNGGTQHNYGLMRYLTRYVDLTVYSYLEDTYSPDEAALTFADAPFALRFYRRDHVSGMEGISARLSLMDPVNDAMLQDIVQDIRERNAAYLFYTLKMVRVAERIRQQFPAIHIIYISHNSEFLNIRDDLTQYDLNHHVTGLRHQMKLWRANLFIAKERNAVRTAEAVYSISDSDSRLLAERYQVPMERFYLSKPMISYTSPRTADLSDRRKERCKLVIVGNMNWYPTAAGAYWFASEVFPRIQKQAEETELYIVGGHPTDAMQQLGRENPGVHVTGFVDSIADYYRDCDIAVIPVFEGTGAKIKVLEALGMHIPTIVSAFAAKDYHGCEAAAVVAEDHNVDDFCSKTLALITDITARCRVEQAEKDYYSVYMQENEGIDRYFSNVIR